jgi:sugar diacid utilization regulator
MIKTIVATSIALGLSGCALIDAYLMKYDSNEYRLVTEIRADAQSYKSNCNDHEHSLKNAQSISDKTRLFMLYSQYQPHNKTVKLASIELNKIAQGLKDQYQDNVPSVGFCEIKFTSIEKSAETIQKTVGDKPK